jgi:S-adenosylmethionine:diacylglycerol 3-amino-3-carboxypropyl transferase
MGSNASQPRNGAVRNAVHRHEHLSKEGLLERAFTFAFRGLVYAQIWEDPEVDMEALAITPDSHIVTIASGGCNVLSYLTANPAKITAVDLNTAHIALNKLKRAAAIHLPDHAAFHRFPHLDDATRRYWEGRDLAGRRRIKGFAGGFYKRGLLGGFIGAAHLLAKLYRIDPRELLAAKSVEEQRAIFETRLAPVFDKKFVRWLIDQPASLFGLGMRRWPAMIRAESTRCCAAGWRSLPAISTCRTIISRGRRSGAAMAKGPTRRCRRICAPRITRRCATGPNGSRCGTRISSNISTRCPTGRSTATSCSMRRTG